MHLFDGACVLTFPHVCRQINSLLPVMMHESSASQLVRVCETLPGIVKMPRTVQLVKQLRKELNIHDLMKSQRHRRPKNGMFQLIHLYINVPIPFHLKLYINVPIPFHLKLYINVPIPFHLKLYINVPIPFHLKLYINVPIP